MIGSIYIFITWLLLAIHIKYRPVFIDLVHNECVYVLLSIKVQLKNLKTNPEPRPYNFDIQVSEILNIFVNHSNLYKAKKILKLPCIFTAIKAGW